MVRIDMVSDIACPWCAIGLSTLERALEDLKGRIDAEIYLQPFELNPDMPPGGQEVIEHLSEKYGIGPDQVRENQQRIYDRAVQVGFEFHPQGRTHVYNTLNCHRLLHWAQETVGWQGALKLKKALFAAYFTTASNMDDLQTLLGAVTQAGLDADQARTILESDQYTQAVRAEETRWKMLGIQAVPAFILDNHFLIQGAQSEAYLVAALEQAQERQQDTQK